MAKKNDPGPEKANSIVNNNMEQEVLITRILDAPRELVFQMWTDPKQLEKWFAPKGCTIRFSTLDIREGGSFLSCISNPDFGECWCVGRYYEIAAPERIVYSMAIADKDGNIIKPEEAGHHADWPAVTMVTITLTDYLGKTKLTLHQAVSASLAKQTGAYPSWLQMLDNMELQLIQVQIAESTFR